MSGSRRNFKQVGAETIESIRGLWVLCAAGGKRLQPSNSVLEKIQGVFPKQQESVLAMWKGAGGEKAMLALVGAAAPRLAARHVRCSTEAVVWVERVVKYSCPTWRGESALLASLVHSQAAYVCVWLPKRIGCQQRKDALPCTVSRYEQKANLTMICLFALQMVVQFFFSKRKLLDHLPAVGSSGDQEKGCLAVCSCSMHPAGADLFLKPLSLTQQ